MPINSFRFHGQLVHGTRLLGEVTGELRERLDSAGVLRWNGFFDNFRQQLDQKQVYRLYLEDGRSGEVLISMRSYLDVDAADAVAFTGLGPLA
jgi:hypothetical protein